MSETRDFLSGLLDKVKDAAENTGVSGVYAMGVERAKAYGRITRLSVGAGAQADELDKVSREIGRLYYEQNAGHAAGLFVPLFEQAARLQGGIEEKNAEIKAIKAELGESKAKGSLDEQADRVEEEISAFDDVVDATTDDGIGKE